jgi:methyltransferase (TIGR00027 family)
MRVRLLPRELHTTDRPSSTAQWTTLGRALELDREPDQRIVTDVFAPAFLTTASRAALSALQLGRPVLRRAERADLAGLAAFALCRHRFIDEHLLSHLAGGATQIVVLGAGYDARAYRFADDIGDRPVFEVDLPPLSRRKAAIVESHRDLFGGTRVRRVEIDFRRDSLAERLGTAGFVRDVPTFVAWEGVSMYLTREAVDATLQTLSEICGRGSVVAMDYWFRVDGTGPADQARRLGAQAIRLIGEPVTFGLNPSDAADFLRAHRFELTDLAQAPELAGRYATDGRHSEKSVYVVAAQLNR